MYKQIVNSNLLIIVFLFFLVSCDISKKSDVGNETPDSFDTLTIPHTAEHELENIPDCIFNKDTVTDGFLKNIDEFSNYSWDNETKEATILLSTQDSLYIHIGGCKHYGVTATLTLMHNEEDFKNTQYWIDQAIWMADRIKGFESKLLHQVDTEHDYYHEIDETGLFIDFHHNDYTLIVDRKEDHTHLTLNHYFH